HEFVHGPADSTPHENTREQGGEHLPAVGLARRSRVALLRALGWFPAHVAPEYSMWRGGGTRSPACCGSEYDTHFGGLRPGTPSCAPRLAVGLHVQDLRLGDPPHLSAQPDQYAGQCREDEGRVVQ